MVVYEIIKKFKNTMDWFALVFKAYSNCWEAARFLSRPRRARRFVRLDRARETQRESFAPAQTDVKQSNEMMMASIIMV